MAKKVRIKKAGNKAYWYADKIGEVYEVAQSPEFREKYEVIEGWRKPCKLLDKDDVSTIREIDGVAYEEVERMAGVGEIVINPDDGIPTKVTAVSDNSVDVEGYLTVDEDEIGVDSVVGILHGYYRVLEPVDPQPSTPTDELLEITANLTRRVHELEREQKKLRDDVTETLGTITDLLRRRDRRIEEIDRKVFDTSSLKTFDLAALNGKQVTLLHGEDGDYEILAAKDGNGNFYVISEKEACE